MFDHFVITRFNLKLENHFHTDKKGNATQTEAWLNNRFALFERFCFPSLQSQSCTNFKWLVLFDKETPVFYSKQIENYQLKFQNFFPLFLETGEPEYIKQILNNAILSMSDQKAQYIITTRIDNDDAFHPDLIQEVQTFFIKHKETGFLNFNYGVQYDINNKCAVKARYENNHFLSRLEVLSTLIDTVIIHNHTSVDKIDKVFSVDNKNNPLWVEIIHDSNISNNMRLSQPILFEKTLSSFKLNLKINKQEAFSLYRQYLKTKEYESFACLFTKIGLFDEYKKIIRLCK
jgi:hypothetical protein